MKSWLLLPAAVVLLSLLPRVRPIWIATIMAIWILVWGLILKFTSSAQTLTFSWSELLGIVFLTWALCYAISWLTVEAKRRFFK